MINKQFKANRPKTKRNTNIKPYWKVVEKIISESDILLEILDARMPELSRNSEIEETISKQNKQLILILNKADLVSNENLKIRLTKFSKEFPTFIISNREKTGTKRLRDYLTALGKKYEIFRVGVLGYPNTGKSAVINSIAMRKKAKVSAKAGTTHGEQWINAGRNLSVVDSPGVIPLKENDELRHALIGSKNVEKIKNLDLVANKIISLFNDKKPLEEFYKIKNISENTEEIISQIGKSRGFLKKYGEIDENRTFIQIIRDWQSGKLRL